MYPRRYEHTTKAVVSGSESYQGPGAHESGRNNRWLTYGWYGLAKYGIFLIVEIYSSSP